MKVTFPTALLLLFIALKLMGYIDWSWWWVTAPAWIPLAIALPLLILVCVLRLFETPRQKAARLLREYGDALSRRE